MNPKVKKMARLLVDYSCEVKRDDIVQIEASPNSIDLVLALEETILKKGAFPLIKITLPGQLYTYYRNASLKQLARFPHLEMEEAKSIQARIFIIDDVLNTISDMKELKSIDPRKLALRARILKPIRDYRLKHVRWCLTLFPTPGLAQEIGISHSEFEDFVYAALFVDRVDPMHEWERLSEKQQRLATILNGANNVRILGPKTDLIFSIEGRTTMIADGRNNMPDGELYTSPVENSVNGRISFERFPLSVYGREVKGVELEFKEGKVITASAKEGEDSFLKLLSTDEGAGYLGEFGIGTNFGIKRFIGEILFDEKIGGTIHLALGDGFSETGGRNQSAIHRDMLFDLRCEGDLFIDERKLVWRRDSPEFES